MKKILVTGATGFVGNYVINVLLAKGYNVIATSSNKTKAQDFLWYNKVTFLPLNFENIDGKINYYEYFLQPDMLIHLAWEGLPNYTNLFHIETNLPRHKLFLKNLVENGLKDISVTGTCLEYGMIEGELNETLLCNPTNAYAIAKNNLRIFIEQMQSTFKFNFKWVRLFYMYGKGQSPNSLFSQLDKALQNGEPTFNMSAGEQERDYLTVETVAQYIVAIATQNRVIGIINCASGKPIKIINLIKQYLKDKQKSIELNLGYFPYTTYEPMRFWGNIKKLKKIVDAPTN